MGRWGWRGARTQVDPSQPEIVKLLRKQGWTVFVLGYPVDLLVGADGVTLLVEVKEPPGPRGGASARSQRLTEQQEKFVGSWCGAPVLVVTINDAVAQVRAQIASIQSGTPWKPDSTQDNSGTSS